MLLQVVLQMEIDNPGVGAIPQIPEVLGVVSASTLLGILYLGVTSLGGYHTQPYHVLYLYRSPNFNKSPVPNFIMIGVWFEAISRCRS